MRSILSLTALLGTLLVSTAAQAADFRLGADLGIDQLGVRAEIMNDNVVDLFLDFSSLSQIDRTTALGLGQETAFGFGLQYARRIVNTDPVSFLVLGGLRYESQQFDREVDIGRNTIVTQTMTTDRVGVYAGAGAEYFLPGSKRFSLSADAGITILSLSHTVETPTAANTIVISSDSGVDVSLGALPNGNVLFHYYFGDR